MIQGLEKFRDWFSGYNNRYVLIGGSACNLIYAKYGSPERTTRDIDIVIVAEAFDKEYYKRFIEFVKAGGYYNEDKSENMNYIVFLIQQIHHFHHKLTC